LLDDNDNSVDQPSMLQARLLDMLIADWDRHEDQWRWYAEKDKKKNKTFYPIPRDRDQAFFVNEGFLPGVMSRSWLLPSIQGFRPETKNINSWNFSSRYLDRNFLHALSEEDWEKQAADFSRMVTDSIIENAVAQFPEAVRSQVSERTIAVLKARRDNLPKQAMEYYRFLAKTVDVTGSQKNEQFTVTRMPEGRLQVTAQK